MSAQRPLVHISTFSAGAIPRRWTNITVASTAYPAANTAYFIPFILAVPTLFKLLFSYNGATASGNIDVGIYSEDGTLIKAAGSTAQAGTTDAQAFDVADFTLGPGRFYKAVAKDDTTGTLRAAVAGIDAARCAGVLQMATAFPLPATAVFATLTADFVPIFGLSTRSFV